MCQGRQEDSQAHLLPGQASGKRAGIPVLQAGGEKVRHRRTAVRGRVPLPKGDRVHGDRHKEQPRPADEMPEASRPDLRACINQGQGKDKEEPMRLVHQGSQGQTSRS